jgi:hypothetical protein
MHMTYVVVDGETGVNSTHRTTSVSPNVRKRAEIASYIVFFVLACV